MQQRSSCTPHMTLRGVRFAVLQAVGIAAFSDLGDVPYYLCAVLCGLYHALAQPLESSFHQQFKAARAIGGGASATPSEAVVQVRSLGRCNGLFHDQRQLLRSSSAVPRTGVESLITWPAAPQDQYRRRVTDHMDTTSCRSLP